jgi:transposase InsO family protein
MEPKMILSLEKLRTDFKLYRKKDPEIAARIDILLSYSKFELQYAGEINQESKNKHISAFLTSMEMSERTIQRWKKDYQEKGADGLGKLKATGRPPVAIRRRIRRVIEAYRIMYRWGSEVIQAHLKLDHDYTVSRFRIEKFLDDSGLREKYPCTTVKKQRAEKKKKHTKVVVVKEPGAHTQMDVKYQIHLLGNKAKCYVYNFIDHASNWSFKHPYAAINARNTKDFMEKIIDVCPFQIARLQTDNGVEFTNKYLSVSDDPKEHLLDEFCNQHEIKHKLIPPGEKELQGLVERSHRQDDQELFSRITPLHLDEFRDQLQDFTNQRNRKRRFKKLSWMTPDQWLENNLIRNIVIILYWKKILEDFIKEETRLNNRTEIEEIADTLKENRNRAFKVIKLAEAKNIKRNKKSLKSQTEEDSKDFNINDENDEKVAA